MAIFSIFSILVFMIFIIILFFTVSISGSQPTTRTKTTNYAIDSPVIRIQKCCPFGFNYELETCIRSKGQSLLDSWFRSRSHIVTLIRNPEFIVHLFISNRISINRPNCPDGRTTKFIQHVSSSFNPTEFFGQQMRRQLKHSALLTPSNDLLWRKDENDNSIHYESHKTFCVDRYNTTHLLAEMCLPSCTQMSPCVPKCCMPNYIFDSSGTEGPFHPCVPTKRPWYPVFGENGPSYPQNETEMASVSSPHSSTPHFTIGLPNCMQFYSVESREPYLETIKLMRNGTLQIIHHHDPTTSESILSQDFCMDGIAKLPSMFSSYSSENDKDTLTTSQDQMSIICSRNSNH